MDAPLPIPADMDPLTAIEKTRIKRAEDSIPTAKRLAETGLKVMASYRQSFQKFVDTERRTLSLLHKHFTAVTAPQTPVGTMIPWLDTAEKRLRTALGEIEERARFPNFWPPRFSEGSHPEGNGKVTVSESPAGSTAGPNVDRRNFKSAIFFGPACDGSPFGDNMGTVGACVLHECWHVSHTKEEQVLPGKKGDSKKDIELYTSDWAYAYADVVQRLRMPLPFELFCFEALFGTDSLKWYNFKDLMSNASRRPFVTRDGEIQL